MAKKENFDLMVQLKADVKNFKQNMGTAKKNFSGFAQSAVPGFALLNTGAGRFIGTFKMGTTAIKSMIPAIKGVKAVLISSGIGAIVLAITGVIAGLRSWIHRTVEGQQAWRVEMSKFKAGASVFKDRLADIGKAFITMAVNADEGAKKMKQAFKGIGDEIRDESKKAAELQERENKLWKEKLDFNIKEARISAEVNNLRVEAERTGKYTAEERLKMISRAEKLEIQLANDKIRLATEERNIQKQRMDLGHNSIEDEEKLNQLEVALLNTSEQRDQALRRIVTKQESLRKEVEALVDAERKISQNFEKQLYTATKLDEEIVLLEEDLSELNEEVASFKLPEVDPEPYKGLRGIFQDVNNQVDLISSGIGGVSNLFMDMASTGKASMKDLMTVALETTARIIQAKLAESIASIIASESKKGLLGLITASVGIAGFMALWKAKVPNFAAGGIVHGETLARVGEYQGARTNPEVIAPLSKLQNMLGRRELVAETRISQGDLLFIVKEAMRKQNNTT